MDSSSSDVSNSQQDGAKFLGFFLQILGMGFGLMYLPSIVIVGYYFDKKRAFATGLATCGSGE